METANKIGDHHTEVNDEAFGSTQTQVQNASNMVELSADIKDFEQKTIVADQKMITMNALVTINKLPVELFTHIIFLAKTSLEKTPHPYLSYTWVCRHWRSVIIQTSAFWTLIQDCPYKARPFDHELFRRSGSAKVDVILSDHYLLYAPMLQNLLSKESNRICNLGIYTDTFAPDLNSLVLSEVQFPSLRRFVLRHSQYDISCLLSLLVASEHLEMLELELRENIDTPANQLDIIFNRIRNLRLTICSDIVVPTVHVLLRSSIKVQKLEIKNIDTLTLKLPISSSDQAILPELQFLSVMDPFLLDYLQAPKLSSLDVRWAFMRNAALNYKIIEEFDFSLIKYLYIRGPRSSEHYEEHGYCILASKKRVDCSSIPDFLFEDTLSHERERDWCHLNFEHEDTFAEALREITLLVLPRLTNLIELHLLYRLSALKSHPVPDFRVNFPQLKFLSLYDLPFLLENIRIPAELSSLNINWESAITPDPSIFGEFDFSSIKCLYILGPESLQMTENYCILGSKERIGCKAFHSVTDRASVGGHTISCDENPSDCFHFVFTSKQTFTKRLLEVVSFILPRLTSLSRLYLLFSHTLIDFREIVTQTPSVEKVVVQRGRKLINLLHLLSKPSLCSRPKHLSFTTFLVSKDLEKYAEDVGKTLMSCIQSRQKNSTQEHLKYIVLRNCPPLSNIWLDALRKIGTEVITEKDISRFTFGNHNV